MKSKLCISFPLLPFVLLILFVACKKGNHSDANTGTDPVETGVDSSITKIDSTGLSAGNNLLIVNAPQCPNAPNYGDSIVFTKPRNGGDKFVEPLNNAGVQGTYLSWPEGLKINRNTGAINVSQSESGVRYNIAFIKKGTQDTCVSQLIVAGMTYLDHIFVLDQHDTLAKPIFNANPFGASICDASDDTDYPDNNSNGNSRCSFDDAAPGSKANDQHLRVRSTSGIINLKRSVAEGLFGTSPRNGATRIIPIEYKLNDASQRAVQRLSVQVIYYDKASNIPLSLQQEVSNKNLSMFNYRVVNGKPRPPLLIIAGLLR
ncbi:hypothetical protein [Longitalea arenae]|uniref:hypothetical protein n=1 Tax=Longitalea arenae TaxID=2812558 RepID=UPI0019679030|nr:hypothetical protein [Longitalea arenae]